MNERHEAYSYHVTFNAMHNPVMDDPKRIHAHTFRIGLYVIGKKDEQELFLNNERIIEEYFGRYRGIRINDLEVFRQLAPTLENMGEVFYKELKEKFTGNGMRLISLDIGDSPICTYSVSEKIILGSMYHLIDEEQMEEYCCKLKKRYEEKVIEDVRRDGDC